MQTVSAEYILGIKEGRALLKANPDTTREDMQAYIDTLKRLLASNFAKPMADTFRGERDFWMNQLKKAA